VCAADVRSLFAIAKFLLLYGYENCVYVFKMIEVAIVVLLVVSGWVGLGWVGLGPYY